MKTKLLLIDNYDSFTYNLVQAFLVLGAEVLVHRNDQITIEQAEALKPTHLCISPGPGTPHDAGVHEDDEHFAGVADLRVWDISRWWKCSAARWCAPDA
jgi:anthranilate/para-aminobenzoate synthase component II